jgi:hypothetical protein
MDVQIRDNLHKYPKIEPVSNLKFKNSLSIARFLSVDDPPAFCYDRSMKGTRKKPEQMRLPQD